MLYKYIKEHYKEAELIFFSDLERGYYEVCLKSAAEETL